MVYPIVPFSLTYNDPLTQISLVGLRSYANLLFNFTCVLWFLLQTKEEVNVFARVCLFVCLLARFKNACVDLNEMLRVDRCRDMDELINFWARSEL